MDKDVESKMNRLCAFYLEAQARLILLRPTGLPTNKSQRRCENEVAGILTELIEARKPRSAAVVKLAYVRAVRRVDRHATLSPPQEEEVYCLVNQLDYRLQQVETWAMLDHRRHIRKLMLTTTTAALGNLKAANQLRSQKPALALEQYARAYVRSIVEAAESAGTLSATQAGDYDGVINAQ